MPLDKNGLITAIAAAVEDMQDKKYDAAKKDYTNAIATAIEKYVKSMTITVTGITTAGSAATQAQVAPVIATIT